jgi:hypothetical protein
MNLNVMDGGKHFVREGVLLPRTETYVQSSGQRWTTLDNSGGARRSGARCRFYLLDETGPVRVNERWTGISFGGRAA